MQGIILAKYKSQKFLAYYFSCTPHYTHLLCEQNTKKGSELR